MTSARCAIIAAAWTLVLLPGLPARAARAEPTAPAAPPSALRPAPAKLPAGFEPYITAHYVVAAADDRLWATFTGDLLERFRLHFIKTFRDAGFALGEQREPLVWLAFHDGADYRAHARRQDLLDVSGMPAYYSCRTNRVAILLAEPPGAPAPQPSAVAQASSGHGDVASPLAGRGGVEPERIRHEAAHQLAYSLGLMKPGVMYPLWVAEGMATSFETCGKGTDLLAVDNPTRRADLLRALEHARLAPLEEFVAMAQLPSADHQTAVTLYGQSWGLWQFLLRAYPGPLRRYMEALARLPMGRRLPQQLRGEFVEAFGPIDQVEAHWQRYLHALAAMPADNGDGR